jgi:colanic acid biosynthesis glycosyl transferase WcaI
MRFIVWGINYAPEFTGIAPYNTALCEFLLSRQHQVAMVTSFPYYPEWRKRPGDKARTFRTDIINQVRVHRCWHYVPGSSSTLKRMLHELSFVTTSFLRVLTLPRPDAYVVVSPPLLLGAAAWLASVFKRAPFLFHVQDLQPDAASSLGMVNHGPLLRGLYALEDFAYRKAACVSGISAGMVRAFEMKGVPPAKTVLFANGIDLPAPEDLPPPGCFRQRMGFPPGRTLAVYSGNLGIKHGVEIVIEAAGFLQGHRVHTIICGDGARREALDQEVRKRGLSNTTLLPLQPELEYLEMMVDADVYLVTQQPGAGSAFFPSKLLKGLAMSKPVLIVADEQSELSCAARKGGFAIVVKPGFPKELAQALIHLAESPEERRRLGDAGRRFVEQFELGRVLCAFEPHLCDMVQQTRVAAKPPDASGTSRGGGKPEAVC